MRLFDRSGRILASRQVITGGGHATQRAAPVHFALQSLTPLRVEVTFMTSKGRVTESRDDVDPAAYHGKSLVIRPVG